MRHPSLAPLRCASCSCTTAATWTHSHPPGQVRGCWASQRPGGSCSTSNSSLMAIPPPSTLLCALISAVHSTVVSGHVVSVSLICHCFSTHVTAASPISFAWPHLAGTPPPPLHTPTLHLTPCSHCPSPLSHTQIQPTRTPRPWPHDHLAGRPPDPQGSRGHVPGLAGGRGGPCGQHTRAGRPPPLVLAHCSRQEPRWE